MTFEKKPNIYNPKYVFFDFETTTEDSKQFKEEGHTNTFLWAILEYDPNVVYPYNLLKEELKKEELLTEEEKAKIKDWREKREVWIKQERDKCIIGTTIDTFIEKIEEIALNHNGTLLCYANNISFDCNFIFKYLLRERPEHFKQSIDFDFYNKKYGNKYKLFTNGKKIYNLEMFIRRKAGKRTKEGDKRYNKNGRVIFKCTYNLFNQSVASMGVSLGMEKTKEFFDKIKWGSEVNGVYLDKDKKETFYNIGGKDLINDKYHWDIFVEYLKNDTLIIREFFAEFQRTIFRTDNEDIYTWRTNHEGKLLKDKNGKPLRAKQDLFIYDFDTIASLSYKLVSNNIKHNCLLGLYSNNLTDILHHKLDYFLKIQGKEDYALADFAYRGGQNVFSEEKQGKILENVDAIDAASMYPWALTNPIPISNIRYTEQELQKDKSYVKWNLIKIKFMIKDKYKKKIRLIPKLNKTWEIKDFKDNQKSLHYLHKKLVEGVENQEEVGTRYLEYGEGTFMVYEKELKIWEEIYDIEYLYKEDIYYEAEAYFKPFIDKYYVLKENATNQAEKSVYKLLLNTVYGAFAKRKQYENLYISDKELYDRNGENTISFGQERGDKPIIYNVQRKKEKTYQVGDKTFYSYDLLEVEEPKWCANKIIAAQCTAYARTYLNETITKIGVDKFVYCDTDSVYFIREDRTDNDLKKLGKECNIDIGEKTLGIWEPERKDKFNQMIVRGAKNYVLMENGKITKSTIAGVSKERQNELIKNDEYLDILLSNSTFIIEGASFRPIEDSYGIYLTKIEKKNKMGKQ